jgi:hypothetical protein
MLQLSTRIARSDSAVGESAGDEYVVLDLSSGRYFGLCRVGEFIWARLDGELELQAVAAEVAEHFDVDTERAAADLLEFVDQLIDRGLAHVVEE